MAGSVSAKRGRKKPELTDVNIRKAENGGFIVTKNFKYDGSPGFYGNTPEPSVFKSFAETSSYVEDCFAGKHEGDKD